MARKPLLTEAEIRSFMKLANLAPIGDFKLHEMGYNYKEPVAEEELPPDEEEEPMTMDAEMGDVDLEEPVDALPDEPIDDLGADELGMDDMDAGMDAEAGGGSVEDQFMDLVQQLADLIGVEVAMDAGAEAGVDDELGMGDEMDSIEGGELPVDDVALDGEEPPADLPPDPRVEDEDEEELPGNMGVYESKEAIVSKVAKRVAARLQAEGNKQKLAEELTEKIFNRLTNKG